jgi:hypothetical protein
MIRRLLCYLGFHRPPPGINPQWSIYWACEGCHRVLKGELADGRHRRTGWLR